MTFRSSYLFSVGALLFVCAIYFCYKSWNANVKLSHLVTLPSNTFARSTALPSSVPLKQIDALVHRPSVVDNMDNTRITANTSLPHINSQRKVYMAVFYVLFLQEFLPAYARLWLHSCRAHPETLHCHIIVVLMDQADNRTLPEHIFSCFDEPNERGFLTMLRVHPYSYLEAALEQLGIHKFGIVPANKDLTRRKIASQLKPFYGSLLAIWGDLNPEVYSHWGFTDLDGLFDGAKLIDVLKEKRAASALVVTFSGLALNQKPNFAGQVTVFFKY